MCFFIFFIIFYSLPFMLICWTVCKWVNANVAAGFVRNNKSGLHKYNPLALFKSFRLLKTNNKLERSLVSPPVCLLLWLSSSRDSSSPTNTLPNRSSSSLLLLLLLLLLTPILAFFLVSFSSILSNSFTTVRLRRRSLFNLNHLIVYAVADWFDGVLDLFAAAEALGTINSHFSLNHVRCFKRLEYLNNSNERSISNASSSWCWSFVSIFLIINHFNRMKIY